MATGATVVFAIYDDTSRPVPFKIYQTNPITVYRTANMAFVEELTQLGYEPSAILLEEDIGELKNSNYQNEGLTPHDLEVLVKTVNSWSLVE